MISIALILSLQWVNSLLVPISAFPLRLIILDDFSSYQYLVESIRKFPDQVTFQNMISQGTSGWSYLWSAILCSGILFGYLWKSDLWGCCDSFWFQTTQETNPNDRIKAVIFEFRAHVTWRWTQNRFRRDVWIRFPSEDRLHHQSHLALPKYFHRKKNQNSLDWLCAADLSLKLTIWGWACEKEEKSE